MSDSKSSTEWQEEANRLNYVILNERRERDELKAQLAESERLRNIAYSALAMDEAEKKRLEGLCDQLSFELEQGRARVEQLRQAADINHAAAEHNCKIAEEWQRQVQELQAQLDAMRLERDEWKAGAEHARQRVAQLQLQVAALQAQLEAAKNEASKTGWVLVGSHLPNREQLDAEIVRLKNLVELEANQRRELQLQVAPLKVSLEDARRVAKSCEGELAIARHEWQHAQRQVSELQAQLAESERLRTAVTLERNHLIAGADHARENVQQLRLQLAELQAQLEAAAVTPAQPEPGERLVRLVLTSETVEQHLREVEAERDNLREQVLELQAQLEAATPDGSRLWQCELTEAQGRLEAALESWRLTKEDLATAQAVRLKLEARLSSYHKHEQELRDILGWARSFQRCGLTIQPSRLVQLMQKITLHDGTAKLFFEEGNQK